MANSHSIVISILLFFVAGICEIGGGYLVWLWLRETMSWTLGVIGGFVLFLYGIIPAFQPSHFHRVYAAYGGIFIVMAIFWGWILEGTVPDKFDILGTVIASAGVIVIFYIPRRNNGEKIAWFKLQ
jgi:small multidrug resistance family-3 protein